MKKIFIAALAIIAISSCKKAKEILDITYRSSVQQEFTVPAVSDPAFLNTTWAHTIPDIVNTVPDELSKNNIDVKKIKEAVIENVVLNIKSPTTQTFDCVKSIKLYMGVLGKSESLIATGDNIHQITPASGSVTLTSQNANIVQYINEPKYYIRAEAVFVKTFDNDIFTSADLKYKVVANPLN